MSAPALRSRGVMRSALFASVALGLALLFVGVGLELVLRAFLRPDMPPGLTDKHPLLRYVMKPGFHGYTYDKPIAVDSRGTRDAERALELGDDVVRVMVLGDSITFGIGALAEETFPPQLEALLRRDLQRPVQVYNLGVGSYNTVDQEIQLRLAFDTYKPQVVILQYTQGNDAYVEPRPVPPTGFRDTWLWQTLRELPPSSYAMTWLVRQTRRGLWLWQSRAAPADRLSELRQGMPRMERMFADDSPGWRASQVALRGIAQFCSERGVGTVFALYGDATHMKPEEREILAPHLTRIQDAARAAGFERALLLDDAFADYAGRELELRVRPDDAHLSPLAHRLAAVALERELLRPPALLPAAASTGAAP